MWTDTAIGSFGSYIPTALSRALLCALFALVALHPEVGNSQTVTEIIDGSGDGTHGLAFPDKGCSLLDTRLALLEMRERYGLGSGQAA